MSHFPLAGYPISSLGIQSRFQGLWFPISRGSIPETRCWTSCLCETMWQMVWACTYFCLVRWYSSFSPLREILSLSLQCLRQKVQDMSGKWSSSELLNSKTAFVFLGVGSMQTWWKCISYHELKNEDDGQGWLSRGGTDPSFSQAVSRKLGWKWRSWDTNRCPCGQCKWQLYPLWHSTNPGGLLVGFCYLCLRFPFCTFYIGGPCPLGILHPYTPCCAFVCSSVWMAALKCQLYAPFW